MTQSVHQGRRGVRTVGLIPQVVPARVHQLELRLGEDLGVLTPKGKATDVPHTDSQTRLYEHEDTATDADLPITS